jgi:hypothetical protein
MNFQPPKGIKRLEKLKMQNYTPETIKWFMPELTEKGHILEIGPEKLWEKYLPIVKQPRSVLGHLH